MRFKAVLNRDGGTLRTMNLDEFCSLAKAIFVEAGHDLDCAVVSGKDVEQALKEAADDPDVDVIVAGGGDGTISAAASVGFVSGKAIAVLPAGTMNLFARALNMPLNLEEALRAIARGKLDQIDIATANGRTFVHQFGVGIHARLVRIRNGMVYRSRLGKIVASMRAIVAAALNPPRFEAELQTNGGRIKRLVSGIAVANNPLGDGPVPVAARLDAGVLGVYTAASVTTGELLKLALDVFTGRWRDNMMVSEAEMKELVLRFPNRKRNVHAVIDGELIALEREVELTIHPGALKVVRPTVPGGPR